MTPEAGMGVALCALVLADLKRISLTSGGAAWNPDPALWAHYLDDQANGVRKVLVARSAETIFAYGNLMLQPSYRPFAERGIPEIKNLVVAEGSRRQGLATRLVAAFEDMARSLGCAEIGIAVGLYGAYGVAQQLYVKLGYVPDGGGITYRESPVEPEAPYPVDDDLVLWMTKAL